MTERHTDHHNDTTGVYTRAQLPEVAAALAALIGEPHPLAPQQPQSNLTLFATARWAT